MGSYLENVKLYLKERDIKNTYIELMTGWDKSKISRLLNENNNLKYEDMEVLAEALGHDVVFFMGKPEDMAVKPLMRGQIAFFAGELNEDERKDVNELIDMFRFYDALTALDV